NSRGRTTPEFRAQRSIMFRQAFVIGGIRGRTPMKTYRGKGRGIDRRTLLKMTAASGALAASGSFPMPAIAQARPIKIGYVSPATGPLAAFAAADQFMLNQFREATK